MTEVALTSVGQFAQRTRVMYPSPEVNCVRPLVTRCLRGVCVYACVGGSCKMRPLQHPEVS